MEEGQVGVWKKVMKKRVEELCLLKKINYFLHRRMANSDKKNLSEIEKTVMDDIVGFCL